MLLAMESRWRSALIEAKVPTANRLAGSSCLLPIELLERSVYRRVGQMVGVVRHHLLRQTEDYLQDMLPGIAGVQKRLRRPVINIATLPNHAESEAA